MTLFSSSLSPSPALPLASASVSPSPTSPSLPSPYPLSSFTTLSPPHFSASPISTFRYLVKNHLKKNVPTSMSISPALNSVELFAGIPYLGTNGVLNSKRRSGFHWRAGAKRKDGKREGEGEGEEKLDDDLRTGLNEVSDEAIRTMLSDDIQRLSAFKKKVDYYGEFLVGEGEMQAARFMFVIKGMLDHKIVEEHEDLSGPYKKAFDRIWSMMEDSGWLLALPGQEDSEAMEMVDDELMPPVLRTPY